MRLLWLDLNSSYAHSSLALPAIHAQMAHATGIEWLKVTATINDSIGSVTAAVARQKPDVIAASCWLFTHDILTAVIARCKALLPGVRVILGGPEFLGDNETFLRANPAVDCVLRGEGEEAFPRWLAVWDCPSQWQQAEGLCWLADRRYVDNGTARVASFDRLAAPESSPLFDWGKPFVQLETTRGCFNTCAFCTSGGDRPVRTIPLERVEERIANIVSHGIHDVRMLDRTFNHDARRAEAMLDIFERFAGKARFHLEVHPGLLTENLRRRIAQLPEGLLHIEAGIQSLNARVITSSKRLGDVAKSVEGLRTLCSLPNVVTHADLIAGLPHTTLGGIIGDVASLSAFGAGEIQLETLKLLPGTVMRDKAGELGIRFSPRPPYEVLATGDMTADDLLTAVRLSRLVDGYYNTEAWQAVTRRLIAADCGFLPRFLDYLTAAGATDHPTSLEKRGLLLYDFCREAYPSHTTDVSMAWIEAGLSLKKAPAGRAVTRHVQPEDGWHIIYGIYRQGMRLCFLPTDDGGEEGFWYGYPTDTQSARPTFKAQGRRSGQEQQA